MKDYILGVDLGGTNIKAAAYRLESYEKVGEKRLPTQVEGGWDHVLGRVLAALEELLRQTPRERVLCVGMGVPGLLDIEAGVSRFSPNFPQWEDVPVAAWLGERLLARPAGWWRAMPWPSPGRGAKSSPPSWGTPPGCWGLPSTAPAAWEMTPGCEPQKKFPVLMFFSCCCPILMAQRGTQVPVKLHGRR